MHRNIQFGWLVERAQLGTFLCKQAAASNHAQVTHKIVSMVYVNIFWVKWEVLVLLRSAFERSGQGRGRDICSARKMQDVCE